MSPTEASGDLTERIREDAPARSARETAAEVQRKHQRVSGFGPISRLLASEDVNDICLNGPGPVWFDAGGAWHRAGFELDADELALLVERLLAHSGKRADRLHPLIDARLSDGSRINVAAAPVGLAGPLVTIRRFQTSTLPLEAFGSDLQVRQLRSALHDHRNIVISGATGAGKTSLVASLMAELPSHERLVVVEDTAELLVSSDAVVRMEAQPMQSETSSAVSLRDLVRNALRMRPDRLVVGEVRGPEALDLLLALNTGHRGCLATCHGGSAAAVLQRLALLAQLGGEVGASAVDSLVATGIDVVVHVERSGAHRRISEIVDCFESSEGSMS